MTASKRTFILFLVATTAATLVRPNGEAGAQTLKTTLEELTRSSTSVVLGQTVTKRSFWNDEGTQILTEITVRVDESVVGDAAEETVITIPGGRVGSVLYEVSDMPIFTEGDDVLVFLWRHPSGRHLVNGGVQGKLDVISKGRSMERVVSGAALLLDETEHVGKATPDDDLLPAEEPRVADVIARIRDYARR